MSQETTRACTLNEYQTQAIKTECDQGKAEDRLEIKGWNLPAKPSNGVNPSVRLGHALGGMTSEVGELFSLYHKFFYYDKPILLENFVDELGDVLWFWAQACTALGVSAEYVMEANLRKLHTRYGDKFTDEAYSNRDTTAEMQALLDKSKILGREIMGNRDPLPTTCAPIWQPMETSPKSTDPNNPIQIVGWFPDIADSPGGGRRIMWWDEPKYISAAPTELKGGWWTDLPYAGEPTLWANLPKNPE